MSFGHVLDNTINRLTARLHDGVIFSKVVTELVNKIDKSPVVTLENKDAFKNYYARRKSNSRHASSDPTGSKSMYGGADPIVMGALVYYLSNTNKFDDILVNKASMFGLGVDDIITLVILNNIHDIKQFCYGKRLTAEQASTLITLKKLSALHNLEHNF